MKKCQNCIDNGHCMYCSITDPCSDKNKDMKRKYTFSDKIINDANVVFLYYFGLLRCAINKTKKSKNREHITHNSLHILQHNSNHL